MAVTVEKLVATLEARIDKYERDLRKAYGTTDRQFTRIERRGRAMERRLTQIGGAASRSFVAAFAGALSLRAAQQLIDSATGITNALKVAGLEGENLKTVYDSLFASAQKNAAPLEALVTLYSRASQSAADLGASQADLLNFTDKIALALRVSGQSANESAGALLQLSQALGNGVVQAEEYNSLLDGGRTILQATAAGLKEAGGSVSTLTRLVKSGKVSSEAFFRAFLAGAPLLEEKVASSETTIGQHLTRLQNVLTDTAGKFDDTTKAGRLFGGAIDAVTDAIETADFDKFAAQIESVAKWFSAAKNAADKFGSSSGLEQIGKFLSFGQARIDPFAGTPFEGSFVMTSTKAVQDRINGAFGGPAPGSAGGLTPEAIRASVPGAVVTTPHGARLPESDGKPITLADYPTKPGSGSGGGSSANDFKREIEQIQRRTKVLTAMTAAQASVNPLVDDYGFAVAKASATQDLLNAAQEQGLIKTADLAAATPALRTQILTLAEGYATAEAQANRLAESQDKVRERSEEVRDLGRDALGGFIQDLAHGTSAADAFASALGKIGDRLLDMALDGLFSGGGGFLSFLGLGGGGQLGIASSGGIGLYHSGGKVGSPSGIRHGVNPSVFAGARRYHQGGIAGLQPGEVPAILQRGEVVLPKNASRSAGGPAITYAPVYNVAQGADPAAIAELKKAQAKDRAEFQSKVVLAIQGARRHSVKI